eukprot:CAMPEP_0204270712 /NCGR_PEP_ID=MMETSP0468-20130131/19048_1 /ASSEMBLY_ACC=CAM_ASM_000383 /TAXON_ID=2969 /ORGANISM="Oxyrrhis marina" /LENGTH=284 /DNA_ID=CAMNT_0051246279 /DNA_START=19 /DNA_END=874 /DNA_ORIENTATION=+
MAVPMIFSDGHGDDDSVARSLWDSVEAEEIEVFCLGGSSDAALETMRWDFELPRFEIENGIRSMGHDEVAQLMCNAVVLEWLDKTRARRLVPVDTALSTESKAQSAQSMGQLSSRAGIQASAPPSPAPIRRVDPMAAVMRSPEIFHILERDITVGPPKGLASRRYWLEAVLTGLRSQEDGMRLCRIVACGFPRPEHVAHKFDEVGSRSPKSVKSQVATTRNFCVLGEIKEVEVAATTFGPSTRVRRLRRGLRPSEGHGSAASGPRLKRPAFRPTEPRRPFVPLT